MIISDKFKIKRISWTRYHVWSMALLLMTFAACQKDAGINDWPQYKHDNLRSGTSQLNLDLEHLGQEWIYQAVQMPAPAWYGPAKEDAYARSGPLPSMRDYDLAYYPIIVGDKLYYASSADDAVHCVDTKSGKELWTFTTGGPIRVAPVYHQGDLYFGSDDGYVYCISANKAQVKWTFSPTAGKSRKVLNNGRLISFWPVRTGVLIEDDKVYFGASLLPWKNSYFCAINKNNGRPEGEGCFITEQDNMTMEGAMASTGKLIVQPQGRIAPVFLNKADGEKKGSLPGTGGCFVLITPDKSIVHPQTSRYKSIKEYVSDKEPEYMTFKGGKEMVIKGDTSFILSDQALSAYHRKTKKILWLRHHYQGHRLILSGDALYVGATDTVYAVSPKNGLPLWKGNVKGTVYAMATAQDALYVSTNEGQIVCFKAGQQSNALYAQNIEEEGCVEKSIKETKPPYGDAGLQLAYGPFVKAVSSDSVMLSFTTREKEAIRLNWSAKGFMAHEIQLPEQKKHQVVLPARKNFIYSYQLTSDEGDEASYEYDNFFNYKKKVLDFSSLLTGDPAQEQKVKNVLSNHGVEKGLVLVIGGDDIQVPLMLAKHTGGDVIVLVDEREKEDEIRRLWQQAGVYGRQLNVQLVNDLSALPIASELANLVWINNVEQTNADEVIRLIAPRGIALVKNADEKWFDNASLDWQVETLKSINRQTVLKKLPFETEGEWTHQYAHADNSAFGGESLWGSTKAEDFEIQWMGRPGPRFQTDRSGRKPSPLAINGRMFVQGNERAIAVDVFNGNILWSADFPGFIRMNINRNCSNWAAGETHLYMTVGQNLLKVCQKTGKVDAIIPLNKANKDWGYIAVVNDKIIGSSTPIGASHSRYHGGEFWYDAQRGEATDKVLSDNLFAMDNDGQRQIWNYQPSGYIINPTITQYNNWIYFVETAPVKLSDAGRGGENIFTNISLVAVDVASGKRQWKRRLNQMPGVAMYSMAAATGKIVIVSSANWKYKIYAYDAQTGRHVWENEQKWFHGDHGGHLSRPAIVNNRLLVKPAVYDLSTGQQTALNVPKSGHGCATYALTEQSVFYRGGSVTQFNFDTHEFSRWERLRPDCWLSTLPAQGMVLSPEAGGGCSCGNWLETSMVMAPVSRAPITLVSYGDDKPDYKEETYGNYTQSYKPNEFIDALKVEIKVKPGVTGNIFYTIDGSAPTKEGIPYKGPIELTETTELNVAFFTVKNDRERKFVRSNSYVRLRPEPAIKRMQTVNNGVLEIQFEKTGHTGEVYYTTDGSEPTHDDQRGDQPLNITEKTLVKAITIWSERGQIYKSEVVTGEFEKPVLKAGVDPKSKQGVNYEYYEGRWKELPDFTKLKPLDKGITAVVNLEKRKKEVWYGMRFKAFIYVPVDGFYTFYTSSDDASNILIHDELVVDNNGSHGARERKGEIALRAGYHPITVEYYQNNGGQSLSLGIEGPGIQKRDVLKEELFYQ